MAYNKTPFKMMGKSPMMKALVGKQKNLPEALKAKIEAAPESPAKKHGYSPAKKYGHSPVKQIGKDAGETAAFEKSVAIEDKFTTKIEKAKGKDKKIARLEKRANNKMSRKVPRAQKKADKKGYDMNNFDGTTTKLKGKDQKSSPAKQVQELNKRDRELTKAELRLKKARAKSSESMTNKQAAVEENRASRLDLKANKNDRARDRKERRLATKEKTGKTGVGEVISKVGRRKESPNKQMSKLKKKHQ